MLEVEVSPIGAWMKFVFGPVPPAWTCWSSPRPTGRRTTNGPTEPGPILALDAHVPPTQAIMVHKRLCAPAAIAWNNCVPGRLIHVRLYTEPRAVDVIAVYQQSGAHSTELLATRHLLWEALDGLLNRLPNRHMLLWLGDFNCTLAGIPSLAPVESFKPIAGTATPRARHPDCQELCRIVKQHRLVGLNCFRAHQGTFTNGRHSSRIDFVFTRHACVDKYAKEYRPQHDFPLIANQVSYHLPLSSSIALTWHRKFAQHKSSVISLRQRERAHYAKEHSSGEWTLFAQQAQALFEEDWTQSVTTVSAMHTQLRSNFMDSFPRAGSTNPIWQDHSTSVHDKWALWQTIRQRTDSSIQGVFKVWRQFCDFQKLHRLRQQRAKEWRARRTDETTSEAAEAAACHDTYKAYLLINRITPKAVRKRIQHSQPLGPVETHAALVQFVSATWADPAGQPVPDTAAEPAGPETKLPTRCMPFSLAQLRNAIRKLKWNKAFAAPFAPGEAFGPCADSIAGKLFELLRRWWGQDDPFLPSSWKDSWMVWLPKPGKSGPSQNSPAFDQLCAWPQWAYVMGRGTGDALARVSAHCDLVQSKLKAHARRTPHVIAEGQAMTPISGGLQLFVDLSRALILSPGPFCFKALKL